MQGVSGSSPLGSIQLDPLQCKGSFFVQATAEPRSGLVAQNPAQNYGKADAHEQRLKPFCALECNSRGSLGATACRPGGSADRADNFPDGAAPSGRWSEQQREADPITQPRAHTSATSLSPCSTASRSIGPAGELQPHARVFLSLWQDSLMGRASFEWWSDHLAAVLRVEDQLNAPGVPEDSASVDQLSRSNVASDAVHLPRRSGAAGRGALWPLSASCGWLLLGFRTSSCSETPHRR